MTTTPLTQASRERQQQARDLLVRAQELVDSKPEKPVSPEWVQAAGQFGDLSLVALELAD